MGKFIKERNTKIYRETIRYEDKSLKKNKRLDINNGAYRKWRKAVFIRDNHTCQSCFTTLGRMKAHHIKTVEYFPKLELDIDNGITLCNRCHKKLHKLDLKELPIDLLRIKEAS